MRRAVPGGNARAMIEQHAGGQEAARDAITQGAVDACGDSKPLSLPNAVLLASATA